MTRKHVASMLGPGTNFHDLGRQMLEEPVHMAFGDSGFTGLDLPDPYESFEYYEGWDAPPAPPPPAAPATLDGVGPGGRTAAQTAGQQYINDAEMEWYRSLPASVKLAVETPRQFITPPHVGSAGLAAPAASGSAVSTLYDAARQAGFTGDALHRAVASALAESGGNFEAQKNDHIENSVSAWQINLDAHADKVPGATMEEKAAWLKNPYNAAKIAFLVSSGGTDFNPWSVWHDTVKLADGTVIQVGRPAEKIYQQLLAGQPAMMAEGDTFFAGLDLPDPYLAYEVPDGYFDAPSAPPPPAGPTPVSTSVAPASPPQATRQVAPAQTIFTMGTALPDDILQYLIGQGFTWNAATGELTAPSGYSGSLDDFREGLNRAAKALGYADPPPPQSEAANAMDAMEQMEVANQAQFTNTPAAGPTAAEQFMQGLRVRTTAPVTELIGDVSQPPQLPAQAALDAYAAANPPSPEWMQNIDLRRAQDNAMNLQEQFMVDMQNGGQQGYEIDNQAQPGSLRQIAIQTGAQDYMGIPAAAMEAYEATEIPVVSPFMRDVVKPAARAAGDFIADQTPAGRIYNMVADALPVLPSTGQLAEAFVPVKGADFAVELLPGIGTLPGLSSFSRQFAEEGAEAAFRGVMAGQGAGDPHTMARLLLRTPESMTDEAFEAMSRRAIMLPDNLTGEALDQAILKKMAERITNLPTGLPRQVLEVPAFSPEAAQLLTTAGRTRIPRSATGERLSSLPFGAPALRGAAPGFEDLPAGDFDSPIAQRGAIPPAMTPTEKRFDEAIEAFRGEDGRLHIEPEQLVKLFEDATGNKYPGGGPILSLDDFRYAMEKGLPQGEWYYRWGSMVNDLADAWGMDRDFVRSVFAITSQQTPPKINLVKTLNAIAEINRLTEAGMKELDEAALTRAISAGAPPKEGYGGLGNITADQVKKIAAAWKEGRAMVPTSIKTPSYYGNLEAGARGGYSPWITGDTMHGKFFGFGESGGGNFLGAAQPGPAASGASLLETRLGQYMAAELGIAPDVGQASMWASMKGIVDNDVSDELASRFNLRKIKEKMVDEDGRTVLDEFDNIVYRERYDQTYTDLIRDGKISFREAVDDSFRAHGNDLAEAIQDPRVQSALQELQRSADEVGVARPPSWNADLAHFAKAKTEKAAAFGLEVSPQRAAELTADVESRSPVVFAATRPGSAEGDLAFWREQQERALRYLDFEPETSTFKDLAAIRVPHRVEVGGVGAWGNSAEPNLRVYLPGGNIDTARWVSAHLGQKMDAFGDLMHQEGFGIEIPGGPARFRALEFDAAVDDEFFGRAMDAAGREGIGIQTKTGSPNTLQFVDYDDNPVDFEASVKRVIAALQGDETKIRQAQVSSELVEAGEGSANYASILENLDQRFDPTGTARRSRTHAESLRALFAKEEAASRARSGAGTGQAPSVRGDVPEDIPDVAGGSFGPDVGGGAFGPPEGQRLFHGMRDAFQGDLALRPGRNSTLFGDEPVQRPGVFLSAQKDAAQDFGGTTAVAEFLVPPTAKILDFQKMSDVLEQELIDAGVNPHFLYSASETWEKLDDPGFVEILKGLGYQGAKFGEQSPSGLHSDTVMLFDPAVARRIDEPWGPAKPIGGGAFGPAKITMAPPAAPNVPGSPNMNPGNVFNANPSAQAGGSPAPPAGGPPGGGGASAAAPPPPTHQLGQAPRGNAGMQEIVKLSDAAVEGGLKKGQERSVFTRALGMVIPAKDMPREVTVGLNAHNGAIAANYQYYGTRQVDAAKAVTKAWDAAPAARIRDTGRPEGLIDYMLAPTAYANASPQLRAAKDNWGRVMLEDLDHARSQFDVDIDPWHPADPDGVYVPKMLTEDAIKAQSVGGRGGVATMGKVGIQKERATEAIDFIDETVESDLLKLADRHAQQLATSTGRTTFRSVVGGMTKDEVFDKLAADGLPQFKKLRQQKDSVHNTVVNLRKMRDHYRQEANLSQRIVKKRAGQVEALEERMAGIQARVDEIMLQDDPYGPGLSHYSGQLYELARDLRIAKAVEMRQGSRSAALSTRATGYERLLTQAIDEFHELVSEARNLPTPGYVLDPSTRRYVPVDTAKAIKGVMTDRFDNEFADGVLNFLEEARIVQLGAGDLSPLTVNQGMLGMASSPWTMAKMLVDHPARLATAAFAGDDVMWRSVDQAHLRTYQALQGYSVMRGGGAPELRQAGRGLEHLATATKHGTAVGRAVGRTVRKSNEVASRLTEYGRFKAWEDWVALLTKMNPNEAPEVIQAGALKALNEVVPGLNLAQSGYGGLRGRLARAPLTSISFALSPGIMAKDMVAGMVQLGKATATLHGPVGAWQSLLPRQQVALLMGTSLLSTIGVISAASAAAFGDQDESMGKRMLQGILPVDFDKAGALKFNGDFFKFTVPGGGTIPIGGPFRSAFSLAVNTALHPAVAASNKVLGTNMKVSEYANPAAPVDFIETRLAGPLGTFWSLAWNNDWKNDKIREGDFMSQLQDSLLYGLENVNLVTGVPFEALRTGKRGGLKDMGTDLGASFAGLNWQPPTQTYAETMNTIAQDIFGRDYAELYPNEKRDIRGDPRYAEATKDFDASPLSDVYAREERDWEAVAEKGAKWMEAHTVKTGDGRELGPLLPAEEVDRRLKAGEITGEEARAYYKAAREALREHSAHLRDNADVQAELAELDKKRKTDPAKMTTAEKATAEYYAIFDKPGMTKADGSFNFDMYEAELKKFEARYGEGTKEKISPSAIPLSPGEAKYRADSAFIAETGWFDAYDKGFELAKTSKTYGPKLEAFSTLKEFEAEVARQGRAAGWDEQKIEDRIFELQNQYGITKGVNYQQAVVLKEHGDELVELLLRWGYALNEGEKNMLKDLLKAEGR